MSARLITISLMLLLLFSSAFAKDNNDVVTEDSDYHKLFLQQSLVLLKKGHVRIDFNSSYERNQALLYLNNYIITRKANFEATLNYGLSERTEVSIALPIRWSESTTQPGNDFLDSANGIDNISFGIKYLIHKESEIPEIVGTFNVLVPTDTNQFQDKSPNVSGYYSASPGIMVIKSVDPAFLFSGLSFGVPLTKRNNSYNEISVNYLLGMALSLNDLLTISVNFSGKYQKNGADRYEPMLLSGDFTYVVNNSFTITPSLSIGLNEDTSDVVAASSFSYTF